RRHRTVDKVEFTLDRDEDTTLSFHLEFQQEYPEIKRKSRPAKKHLPPAQRRDQLRRALLDHGGSARPPDERLSEPLWRTPERAPSSRWSRLDPRPPPPKATRPIVVDIRDEEQKRDTRY